MKNLYIDPRYKRFTKARNKALEQINFNAQLKMTDALSGALGAIKHMVTFYAHNMQGKFFTYQGKSIEKNFEHMVHRSMEMIVNPIVDARMKLNRLAYLLSYVGEAEAIGQAVGSKMKASPNKHQDFSKDRNGRPIDAMVRHNLNEIATKIIQAFKKGAVMEESVEEIIKRVVSTFPKQKYAAPRVALKKPTLKEAAGEVPNKVDMSFSLMTDAEWDELISEINTPYRPAHGLIENYDENGVASWTNENDATQDFVDKVRSGQIESARENGITDFIWVAILDQKTCEHCCAKRDGLTVSEIEAKLLSEWSGDECDVAVPPAHDNCRCDLAPTTADMPREEGLNVKDFEEWIQS